MKIVVPIKQVAELDEDFEFADDGKSVDPGTVDRSLNEWDSFSVEAALRLQEEFGGEVVVMTVGDEETEEGLLESLAKGCARAVRIWDESLEVIDSMSVACILNAAMARENPDLVLCGAQSSDEANGSTGIALAGFLGLPHVAVVSELSLEADSDRLTVGRELEGGLIERLEVDLPALLTIQTGIHEPRYANLRAIKQAREKPLDVLDLADIGLDTDTVKGSAGARIRKLSQPSVADGAEMITGSPSEIASRIEELINERVPA